MERPDEAQQEASPVAVKSASGKYGDALVDFESRYTEVFFTTSLRLSVVFLKSRCLTSEQPHSISLGTGEHPEKLASAANEAIPSPPKLCHAVSLTSLGTEAQDGSGGQSAGSGSSSGEWVGLWRSKCCYRKFQ